jgi:hypothetical protein
MSKGLLKRRLIVGGVIGFAAEIGELDGWPLANGVWMTKRREPPLVDQPEARCWEQAERRGDPHRYNLTQPAGCPGAGPARPHRRDPPPARGTRGVDPVNPTWAQCTA